MTAGALSPLAVDLAAWPGVVIHVARDGGVTASNGHLEALLGRGVVGEPLEALLDQDASLAKWRRASARLREASPAGATPAPAPVWELVFCADDRALEPCAFSILPHAGGAWLVEQPAPPRLREMGAEVAEVNAELSTAQRALVIERARLARALAELERSNHALDEFAQAVSHDLKAPLRAIHEYAGLLTEPGQSTASERAGFPPRIAELVSRMREMIDGALAYARAGRVGDRVEMVDSAALLREVVAFLAPPAGVAIELDAGLPLVHTERVPFEQVFRNLLSNAITYRRPEGARIRVSARDAGEAWEFEVTDNGPGIPASQQERIWQLFHTSRPGEGTGLGLALVRRIVEAHQGRVTVRSAPGEGAAFHVCWPKRPAAVRGHRDARADGQH
jgi:signal transduction histidine kinase